MFFSLPYLSFIPNIKYTKNEKNDGVILVSSNWICEWNWNVIFRFLIEFIF